MVKKTTILSPAAKILTLEEKVAFLKKPSVYPNAVSNVETRETHMSWVFLAGDFAYKLKKPVKYRYLDLRILDARLRNCREEVRLNRRLAADVYIGIVPLTIDENGNLVLDGNGAIADWLVKMKRIPEEKMLDQAIRNHAVAEGQLRQAATLLATFYQRSPGIVMAPGRYIQKLRGEVQTTYRQLRNPAYKLPAERINILTATLLHFLADHAPVFEKRVTDRRIIEAHGDLRPEHICLGPDPAIIDCLEFKRELRILDTAEELSFLAMECEMLGDAHTGKIFYETYSNLTADHLPPQLVTFYKMKRAMLRIFLVIRHITEPAYKNDPKWPAKADAYLGLAEKYSRELSL